MKLYELENSSKKKNDWFSDNIEQLTSQNDLYRNVLYTGTNLQLVVMSIEPESEIGSEVHDSGDQFIRIESGQGEFIIDGNSQSVSDGDSILIPAGVEHNVRNTGDEPLKLYALYAPPEHPKGTKQKTKSLKEDIDSQDFDFAIEDFTKAVIESLKKQAERVYRKSGEPWDPRINELEKQYLDSLQVDDLRNWVRFSYLPYKDQRRALFFVLKSDTQKFKAGDVFEPNMQQRPNTTRNPIANVLDPESYLFMMSGY